MGKLIDIQTYPIKDVLDLLLKDKTTKGNIIWVTDTYEELGSGYSDKDEISALQLLNHPDVIKPRIAKDADTQLARTRKKAEVYTPVWLCCQMCNYLDDEWFGREHVFNKLYDNHYWNTTDDKITFPEEKTWQQYVDSRRLEITCGEAPFLVSRYDTATGNLIVPPKRRIGLLDRKLRIVDENTDTLEDWMTWTTRAFQSVYGYELQGDNLLIARINLLMTFVDYYEYRWRKQPTLKELRPIANIIAWNIWQMDGFKDTVPLGKPLGYEEVDLFAMPAPEEEPAGRVAELCKIRDWRSGRTVVFHYLKER